MRLTLDSNILIYALFGGDRRHGRAVDVIDRASRADCIQTLQSYGECFRVLVHKHGLEARDAAAKVSQVRSLFQVTAATPDRLDVAMEAVARHRLSFWDAMLWATAKAAGCRLILSEDGADGRDLDGVVLLNPFDPGNDRALDLALPPLEPDP
ncbi:MAG: PIN domain-containing protein [Geminicoccaceae bacterium]